MAIDPKKWTLKTQEAVRRGRPGARQLQPRAHPRPPAGRAAPPGRHGRAGGAGQARPSPADGAQPGRRGGRQAAPRLRRRRAATRARAQQRRSTAPSSAGPADDFLSVEHLLLAMNDRLGVGSEELLRVLATCAAGTASRPEPGGQVRRAREVRPGPHRRAARRQDRPGHRARRRDPPRDPGAVAAHQEQPGADRRARRRQDRDRRGPRPAHRRRRRARGAQGQAPDRASTSARCWPAPSTAASSRSASRPCSRRSPTPPAR